MTKFVAINLNDSLLSGSPLASCFVFNNPRDCVTYFEKFGIVSFSKEANPQNIQEHGQFQIKINETVLEYCCYYAESM